MARKKTNNDLPTFDELLVPTIKALQELGGSGTIEEINGKVYGIAEINEIKNIFAHNFDVATEQEVSASVRKFIV